MNVKREIQKVLLHLQKELSELLNEGSNGFNPVADNSLAMDFPKTPSADLEINIDLNIRPRILPVEMEK